ncbi:MAG: hypothetical protein ACKO3H_07615 [Verrucomicrobiota bacterium]
MPWVTSLVLSLVSSLLLRSLNR